MNTEKALERLLEAVPLDKRDQLRQKLQSSIEIYSLDKEDIEGSSFFQNQSMRHKKTMISTEL